MANRTITLVNRKSTVANRPLPLSTTIEIGEGLINTADGKLFFRGFESGVGSGTFIPTETDSNYFEVGSKLYRLHIEDKIISYEGQSGAGLVGKFLSGTTSGFTLADVSSIQGIDTFTTGGTYDGTDIITINDNQGGSFNISGVIDTFVTGGTYNPGGLTLTLGDNQGNNVVVSGFTASSDTFVTGGTYNNGTEILTFGLNDSSTFDITGITDSNDNEFTTGGTYDSGTGIISFGTNSGTTFDVNGVIDTFTTGGTYDSGSTTITINDNQGGSFNITGISTVDTFTSGASYSNNTFTFNDNQGGNYSVALGTLTGLTVNGDTTLQNFTGNTGILTNLDVNGTATITTLSATTFISDQLCTSLPAGLVVYTDATGCLTGETEFNYNDITDTLSVGNVQTSSAGAGFVGTGGLVVGSGGDVNTPGTGDLIVHGSLTVFGDAISANTSELYVEDTNITINYNPTTGTEASSIGAGLTIQDAFGVAGTSAFLQMAGIGSPANIADGIAGRYLETNVTDFMIRSSGGTGTGNFVLAELDLLDGGTY